VRSARAWTDEMNGARGRKIRPAGGNSVLKGSSGEGGGWVGAVWRQSGRERERERGGRDSGGWRGQCDARRGG
jgi:hypothetical protein